MHLLTKIYTGYILQVARTRVTPKAGVLKAAFSRFVDIILSFVKKAEHTGFSFFSYGRFQAYPPPLSNNWIKAPHPRRL